MNSYPFDVSIIGGDLRFKYLAEYLLNAGISLISYGMESRILHPNHKYAERMEEAVRQSKIILGPIPFCKKDDIIVHKGKQEDMSANGLVGILEPEQCFFAGCIPDQMKELLFGRKVSFYDFMEDDALAIFNSIATAEGVIAEAVKVHPGNLHDSKILVLGYGTCAKTLADKLRYLTAGVTVCARDQKQLSTAMAYGLQTITYDRLDEAIKEYDLIFNTVPKIILDHNLLKQMDRETVILDIASSPGGVDYKSAAELGRIAQIYPGLPGKYAPKASGEALALYVLQIVK